MNCAVRWVKVVVVGCMIVLSGMAYSADNDIEGTWWHLVKRVLADGTVITPPAITGYSSTKGGVNHLFIEWTSPEGRASFVTQITRWEWFENEVAATPILMIMDDGKGKPPIYKHGGDRWSSPLKREGNRVSYQHPINAPYIVREGGNMTATIEGRLVDYWQRIE